MWSRILKDTKSRCRIFPGSDSGSPIELFLHLVPVETVRFLLKLLLKQNSCCVPRFPLIVSCYKIVDNQTFFTLC